jgi:hypothetical protein
MSTFTLRPYQQEAVDRSLAFLHSRSADNGIVVLPTGSGKSLVIAGTAALGPSFEPLPTGAALRRYWLDRLPAGETAILTHVLEAYPKAIERETLSERTGYKRSSRDTYLQRLSSRKLVITDRDGVRASDNLF